MAVNGSQLELMKSNEEQNNEQYCRQCKRVITEVGNKPEGKKETKTSLGRITPYPYTHTAFSNSWS